MGPIVVRRYLRRLHRRVVGVAIVFALASAVTIHHSGVTMGDMHHDGMSSVVELCLTALVAVGATVVAVVLGMIGLGRWRILQFRLPTPLGGWGAAPEPRVRAGPPLILLLCSLLI